MLAVYDEKAKELITVDLREELENVNKEIAKVEPEFNKAAESAEKLKAKLHDIKLDPMKSDEAQALNETMSNLDKQIAEQEAIPKYIRQFAETNAEITKFENKITELNDKLAEEADPKTIISLKHQLRETKEEYDV
ncbi:MAG: hypothetical protein LBC86_03030 [Oscillospiraceae bacterium]|nr:hypothetical protein [Oscillospiraceae bacterium]